MVHDSIGHLLHVSALLPRGSVLCAIQLVVLSANHGSPDRSGFSLLGCNVERPVHNVSGTEGVIYPTRLPSSLSGMYEKARLMRGGETSDGSRCSH